MSLQEHFSRSGNWLFRHRSYVPLLGLALHPAAPRVPSPTRPVATPTSSGSSCASRSGCSGSRSAVHVAGHVPAGTSGRNTRGQIALELNTTGLYSIVRHPLYVGNFLMWLGLAMFPHRRFARRHRHARLLALLRADHVRRGGLVPGATRRSVRRLGAAHARGPPALRASGSRRRCRSRCAAPCGGSIRASSRSSRSSRLSRWPPTGSRPVTSSSIRFWTAVFGPR